MTRQIKLITINVWHGLDANGILRMGEYEPSKRRDGRYDLLVSGIGDKRPDVMGIQEANRLPAYARRLSRATGYDAVWKVGSSGVKLFGIGFPTNFTEGNAIFAKRDLKLKYLGFKRLYGGGFMSDHLSLSMDEVINVIAAMVVIDGRPLIVFNTHIHYSLIMGEGWEEVLDEMIKGGEVTANEEIRVRREIEISHEKTETQIERLHDYVRDFTKRHPHPYVIMGDFNATLDSPALMEMVTALGLIDPYHLKNPDREGNTWDPRKNTNSAYDTSPFWADGVTRRPLLDRLEAKFDHENPRRIDFIFLSRHFTPEMITGARLVFDEPGCDDHNNGTGKLFVSDHFGVEVHTLF